MFRFILVAALVCVFGAVAHAMDPIWQGSAFDANTLVGKSAPSGSAPTLSPGGQNADANVDITINGLGTGGVNTTSAAGFKSNGSTVLKMFGTGTDAGACTALCDTLVGTGAGAALDSRDKMDTFVGWFAGGQMNTGASSGESTCFGYKACFAIISGSFNTALGLNALGTNSHAPSGLAVHDIAIGTDSFRQAYDANQYNVGIGVDTFINSGDTNSIGIGDGALAGSSTVQTTGVYNVAIGVNAMDGNSAGGVGGSETSSSHNVAVGAQAMRAITSAGNNVAVGFQAGLALTVGSSNVFVGQGAGKAQTGNGNNTYIGNGAGQAATTETFGLSIGFNVGSTNARTGSHNVLIGTDSSVDTPTAGSTNGSNNVNIANVLVGSGSNATNPAMCGIMMECVLGVLRGANFNVTTDQAIPILPLTASVIGHMSSATKYIVTRAYATNCSAAASTAVGGIYDATSKGGNALVAATQAYTPCASASTMQSLTLAAIAGTTVESGANLYLSLTTPQGSALTGDVYIMGYPIN